MTQVVVRDLWAQRDVDTVTQFSVRVPSGDCAALRLTPTSAPASQHMAADSWRPWLTTTTEQQQRWVRQVGPLGGVLHLEPCLLSQP